jgi:uncharacterized protein (DUF885 family)
MIKIILLFFLFSCSHFSNQTNKKDVAFRLWLTNQFEFWVDHSPGYATYLGRKTNYHKLDDQSSEHQEKMNQAGIRFLSELNNFNRQDLSESEKLNYDLMKESLEEGILNHQFRYHFYPINHMFGAHNELISFMTNQHRIDSVEDAKDYLSRLRAFEKYFKQIVSHHHEMKKRKIIPPRFIYQPALNDIQNILSGSPFDSSTKMNVIKEDFAKKIEVLKISQNQKNELLNSCDQILLNEFKSGYHALALNLKKLAIISPLEGTADTLPKGKEFYQSRLRKNTTTDMNADEIHQLGLREVKRIHQEMEAIQKSIGFHGSLKDFFKHIQTNPKLHYTQDEDGRQSYLRETEQIVSGMNSKLDLMFNIKPKAKLVVKAVEEYRQDSAGEAFYEAPSRDGKRPGIYYVNLKDMKAANKYEMEALAYHEAIPGHHMQIAINQELENIPEFRKDAFYTAYTEGWGLYSEFLPKEFGFYQDPYSDFGRLSMELWRATRLVVDTGLHSKRWSIKKATDYLDKNTPGQSKDNLLAVHRYIVMPGQATAYKVGQLKILELREMAKQKLGVKFDLKEFHHVILANGALPLSIVEKFVHQWIKLPTHGR